MSYCSKCGKEKNETDKFCANCGYSPSGTDKQAPNPSNSGLGKSLLYTSVIIVVVVGIVLGFAMIDGTGSPLSGNFIGLQADGRPSGERFSFTAIDRSSGTWTYVRLINTIAEGGVPVRGFPASSASGTYRRVTGGFRLDLPPNDFGINFPYRSFNIRKQRGIKATLTNRQCETVEKTLNGIIWGNKVFIETD